MKVIQPNYESVRRKHDRQTGGEKVHCQEGNNLDQKLRSLKQSKCKMGFTKENNEKVGLEPAIFERFRYSSPNKFINPKNYGGLSCSRNSECHI